MKDILRKILFPNTTIKEYQSVTINGSIQEKVYLKTEKFFIDISETHYLLCLEPMVFGIWHNKEEDVVTLQEKSEFRMHFTDSICDNNNLEKNSVAILTLDFFNKIEDECGTLFLLRLKRSRIYHISLFKTLFLFFGYYRKPGLSFNKFKSFVAAFSYPRKVRLISFNQNKYYTIFPMDLLGEIKDCNRYVFGLRHSNAALSKIIESKKIVVSEVSFKYKNILYQLGKYHKENPSSFDSLSFKITHTSNFGFYIPEWAENYKEIKILTTINLGSQMLLWGDVVNEKTLNRFESNLYHIHFLLYLHQQKKRQSYQLV
jgi:uncharacterized protein YkuJ